MALPVRALADLASMPRLPIFGIVDDTDDNPIFAIAESGVATAIGINWSALFDANGKLSADVLEPSFLKFSLLAGADGDPATYELTGAALGDEVVFVGHISTAASIATLADVTADFSITGADELTDGGPTDYSNDQLLVVWIDKTS